MIVFTTAYALAQAATATPLTYPRIAYKTYTRNSGVGASSVVVSSESANGPRDAPLRPDTAEYWEPTAMPATWRVDSGSSGAIDYCGIAGHNCGSKGVAVKVETSPDAAAWTMLATEQMPADDAPLLFLDTSRNARYLRVTLTGASIARLGVVYFGPALATQRAIYGGHSPLTLARETELRGAMSRGGQFLGQDYRSLGVVGQAALRNLTAAWYRASFDPFVKEARRYPYFFAWRPQTFPLEVAYVWTDKDIRPSNMGKRDLMDVSWPMRGVGHE